MPGSATEPRAAFESKLIRALALDLPYPDRQARESGIPLTGAPVVSSVLLLLGYHDPARRTEGAGPSLLFTRRTETVETHKGQIAFPGGVAEREEIGGEISRTALRETEEEVGIPASQVRVMGKLPSLLTITGFRISPVVGILSPRIEETPLRLNEAEIAAASWIPLSVLLSPGTYRRELYRARSAQHPAVHPVDVFLVGDQRIWGATGSMTKNLLDRLRTLG